MTAQACPTAHPLSVDRYLDGGAVLLGRPYTDAGWRVVREGWWWHAAGMVVLVPVYPVIALTAWQGPSRQPLARRLVWAVALTLGALLLVGLPAFVVFSRRWYWLYRTGDDPEGRGLGERPPEPGRGYLEAVAAAGAALADALTGARPDRGKLPRALPALVEPWGSLRAEAATSSRRIGLAEARATGPARTSLQRAQLESVRAFRAASRAAERAAEVERTLRSLDRAGIEERLQDLGSRRGDTHDLEAAGRAWREQLAAADRMAAAVERLEGQLHRMVAQLGEAAARAEELALCPPGSDRVPSGELEAAADDLTAIRLAIEAVELADLPATIAGLSR